MILFLAPIAYRRSHCLRACLARASGFSVRRDIVLRICSCKDQTSDAGVERASIAMNELEWFDNAREAGNVL